jgi:predicted HicB family RNase H-like nuclease
MTLQSIIPQQAEAAGISLNELITEVIDNSLAKKA